MEATDSGEEILPSAMLGTSPFGTTEKKKLEEEKTETSFGFYKKKEAILKLNKEELI